MGDWEEQLNTILGDPRQMERIAGLARSLMGGGDETADAPEAPDLSGAASLLQSAMGGGRDKVQVLLEAMEPWLTEKRRAKLGRARKLARMAKLAELAMGEGGQGDV
jgi:hypothetical protein